MMEVNSMVPELPPSSVSYMYPNGAYVFSPNVFLSSEEEHSFLSSLDSDTRDYVLKHTKDYHTRQDIINRVNDFHGKS